MPDKLQFTAEQMAEMERQIDELTGHYLDPTPVMMRAMMIVLTARLGIEFARDVRDVIIAQADNLAASDDPEDRMDATLVRAVAERSLFDELGVI